MEELFRANAKGQAKTGQVGDQREELEHYEHSVCVYKCAGRCFTMKEL